MPLINSRGCDLLDNDRMLHQLVSLERRTARGGRDCIGEHSACNLAQEGTDFQNSRILSGSVVAWRRSSRRVDEGLSDDSYEGPNSRFTSSTDN